MRRLRKFLGLGEGDRHLLVKAFILLGFVRLGLWLLPFRILLQLLTKISHTICKLRGLKPVSIGKVIWAVNLSTRWIPGGAKCLARALTTQFFLQRSGYSSELRIGVAKDAIGKLEAHAWIEIQGQVVIGHLSDLSRYTTLPSFEGASL
ncbi:MAG: lasso peptide biosynthesis B2 protein [Cyanothece sp. SIO1E1]|nr:lasso peptide biosynthesis B2 protein [Cyanothece sp. SIO1E1]